jgi:hypothetical protein
MTIPAETTLPLATVHGLYHLAIKTDNLAATRKFWSCSSMTRAAFSSN